MLTASTCARCRPRLPLQVAQETVSSPVAHSGSGPHPPPAEPPGTECPFMALWVVPPGSWGAGWGGRWPGLLTRGPAVLRPLLLGPTQGRRASWTLAHPCLRPAPPPTLTRGLRRESPASGGPPHWGEPGGPRGRGAGQTSSAPGQMFWGGSSSSGVPPLHPSCSPRDTGSPAPCSGGCPPYGGLGPPTEGWGPCLEWRGTWAHPPSWPPLASPPVLASLPLN